VLVNIHLKPTTSRLYRIYYNHILYKQIHACAHAGPVTDMLPGKVFESFEKINLAVPYVPSFLNTHCQYPNPQCHQWWVRTLNPNCHVMLVPVTDTFSCDYDNNKSAHFRHLRRLSPKFVSKLLSSAARAPGQVSRQSI
jgi:hypothetical protein